MSETVIGNLGDYLKMGVAVSIQGQSEEPQLAATVETISSDTVWLQLSRPTSQPAFKMGDQVQLKYWDEGAIVYGWKGEVIEIAGTENERLALSIGREVTIQRRKSYRVRARIPLSFTVIDAAEAYLVGEKVTNSETDNISVGGLLFKSNLLLKVGDRLALNVHFSPSQQVNAAGWVVRSQPAEKEGQPLHSVALKFLQLDSEEQNHLLKFLKSYYE